MQWRNIFILTFVFLLFAGCGMVPRNQNWVQRTLVQNATASREHISIIRCAEPLLINFIDDISTRYDYNSNAKVEFVLSPGNHRIVVMFGRPWDGTTSDPAVINVSLEPGQVIEIKEEHIKEWGSTKWRPYIIDITEEYWRSKSVSNS